MANSVRHTASGWPYLDSDSFVDEIDDYSTELADKLESGAADVAGAINAANRAQAAAASVPWKVATGSMAFALSNQATLTKAVSFPAGTFTAPPTVMVTGTNSGGGSQAIQWFATQITKDGFNLVGTIYDASSKSISTNVAWLAVQAAS